MKKRILSGAKPSGNLTIGNYIGAISQWVKLQENSENWFMIADLHAMTVPYNPKILKEKTIELFALYLACGLDPEKSTIFVQSQVHQHAELTWILNCNTPIGWMNQMIQFKEKSRKLADEGVSVGLFDYPVLQAADILLYQTDQVPVGEDQSQHVEISREIARRFNRIYGEIFKEPEAINPPQGARIMGLDNPNEKMSKTADSKYNYIWLLDKPEDIMMKISKAVTDSGNEIIFSEDKKALFNLLTIYQSITNLTKEQIEKIFSGKSYAEFKTDLAERVIELLQPIQEKYQKITENLDYVYELMTKSAYKASAVASLTLEKAKKKTGLIPTLRPQEMKEKPEIAYEDWQKMDVRVGEIKTVKEVAGADKLYEISIDFGEKGKTTIVAGIKEYYKPEELIGRQIPILANLAEKELRGIKSKGMMLCVDDKGKAILLNPEKKVENGAGVR